MTGAEDLTWVPDRCANGHLLNPRKGGRMTLSWVSCTCPRSSGGGGHHAAYCAESDCKAPRMLPPDCTGPVSQR